MSNVIHEKTNNISQLPVCIIGAGSSGVTAAKHLKERHVPFDCFEAGSNIGGMWRYENDNGMSSAYRSLHVDTSRKNLGYSDFPVPDRYPDFLSHYEVIEYLEAYAQSAGVLPLITFNTKVLRINPNADGSWQVDIETGQSRRYRAVIVANGHLWDPRMPEFPGSFSHEMIHSHHYRKAEPFTDKNVLVVGIGNSAVDIAVDVCKSANRTFLSTRRSAWVMPKYIMGKPLDRWIGLFSRKLKLPTPLSRAIVQRIAFMVTGDQSRFGIPKPTHPIWREHTTLSQELLPYCGHGWIKVKPNVKALQGDHIDFEDGSREKIDAIVYATGYKTTFPFLDEKIFSVRDGQASLYRRIMPVERPGLFMLGLIQPVGPTIPLVEVQAKWTASVLAGSMDLPSDKAMKAEVAKHRKGIEKRYVGSARYTLEVDAKTYARALYSDIGRSKAGA